MADGCFDFAIDRGGTFTDVHCRCPGGKVRTLKLLSEDPANYRDAPTEAIRRILEEETGLRMPRGRPIDSSVIGSIRMGTTVATNALLERKGEPTALVITKGFKDLLYIGNQSRPNLFDLSVTLPDNLYETVIEVEERVYLRQNGCQLGLEDYKRRQGVTKDEVFEIKPVPTEEITRQLEEVFKTGIRSLAIVLMHSYMYPDHEIQIEAIASKIGFTQISLSSKVMPMVRIVPRGYTVCVDAYLTPAIKKYLDNFQSGFKDLDKNTEVLFMQSDGGLAPVQDFSGSRAILSGPAGGVIGYGVSLFDKKTPLIGFDMGGTSTDVSRYSGTLEHVFETTTAGVTIQAPQLDINTVAAGGGSRLFFRSGLFIVGPESAGAHPGPACYKKGGPLTITDANLVLNRLIPDFFPNIFGPNCDEALSREASLQEFQKLTARINSEIAPRKMTVEEVALGFVKVANESMCRPIRALTQGKGYDTSKHTLACFGGAGGQHACAIASSLGMSKIIVHKYAGILSAYGMALADVVAESQLPANLHLNPENFATIRTTLQKLLKDTTDKLKSQSFRDENIEVEMYLHLRYEKTDCALMVPAHDAAQLASAVVITDVMLGKFPESFSERYTTEFGFSLPNRTVIVDDIRVRALGKSRADVSEVLADKPDGMPVRKIESFFEQGKMETPVYMVESLSADQQIDGPAIIIDKLNTMVVEPNCVARVHSRGHVIIEVPVKTRQEVDTNQVDSVQLSIFSHRFMSIAEQMGRVLQKTAISTNIKERLDFSCAMFGRDGGLVANAPHIPVHLGAMQETVKFQMKALEGDLHDGDVILTNHPMCGGSHLPDLTVITPVFDQHSTKPVFFVASRGHHADIGGITPGSMPPFSTILAEEGAVFKTFKVVEKGVFREEETVATFMAPADKVPGSCGSRNIRDNIADLKAQIAANNKGISLIKDLIQEYSLPVVQAYMEHIRENAELAVRDMLKDLHSKLGGETLRYSDKLDCGAQISVAISVDGGSGSAVVDFEGTSPELHGNQCAPRAVCMSALIYCLRSMVQYDIPLNQGCLEPVDVRIPPRCLLDPGENTAVVGGNVTTSQRIVDVVLQAFRAAADSQGCCNNCTFGNDSFGYYETVAGGAGAGDGWTGRSGVHTHMTNTRITDPEILERYYPVVLDQFRLRDDNSGGQGAYRGGEGVIRSILFRQPVLLSLLTERRVLAPQGLSGGGPGKCGENTLVRPDGSRMFLGPKISITVGPGEKFVMKTPGGGGFGSPDEEAEKKASKPVELQKGSVHQYKLIQESA